MLPEKMIIGPEDLVLVTGAPGFIGSKVVETLLERGFHNLRCFARPSSNSAKLEAIVHRYRGRANVEVVTGNLLSREDCIAAAKDVTVVYHLAAGRGQKMYADAYMNSVVTTRNLIEGCLHHRSLRRFVSISSFSVYSNTGKPRGRLLDESCPVEQHPELRGDAYAFAKVKQDEMVAHYHEKFGVPSVIVRPGYVYGPGNESITGRVGIGTFGIFLHLGGSNRIPLTFVDNCAEAIVLAGLKEGVNGEIFNVVDDDLPSSSEFLRLYKLNVRRFPSIYLPHMLSYLLCYLWEKYSEWSEGQLPPVYGRKEWHTAWKPTRYTNEKLKSLLGWVPRVSSREGLGRFFESCKQKGRHA